MGEGGACSGCSVLEGKCFWFWFWSRVIPRDCSVKLGVMFEGRRLDKHIMEPEHMARAK